jgi:hypothetical protein
MQLQFLEYLQKRDFEAYSLLSEKLIVFNNGAKYGQIVFLAGGAGSGKGFAINNYISGNDFKIRDVDELKIAFQKLDGMGKFTTEDLLKKYGDKIKESDAAFIEKHITSKGLSLSQLNLKVPEHVYALHVLVRATGVKEKTLDLLLDGAKENILPNVLFDSTFADMSDLEVYLPKLIEIGYDPKNIHIAWVLTNYEIAMKNNAKRDRVVPDDILLRTHRGAAQTILSLVKKSLPVTIDGGIYVILNNPDNTMFLIDPKTGEHYKDIKGKKVVKDFLYITMKKPGKAITNDADVKKQLYTWIKDNVPPNSLDTKELDDL